METEHKKKWILVAEEHAYIQKLLFQVLSKMGYFVTLVGTSEEGMECFHEKAYSLVLTDLTMPGIDGLTFARWIKKRSPRTLVCLLTGWERQETDSAIKEGSVDVVLCKLLGLYEIRETVERLIKIYKKKE
ncbi:MAG: response regulator [Actinobacteria bacterium]|nr:response regulator [Actinomycetota bacterium]